MERKAEETGRPLLTCKFSDKELDFTGYIVIDSMMRGKSCGGVRLSSEVTPDETTCLARNMTLKYAFLGIPLGGAKVGIRRRNPLTETERKSVFTKIGKILSPFIIGGSYVPGPDMGTSDEDIDCLLNAATNKVKNRKHAPTPLYTSWTMLVSAAEALNELDLELKDATVAIEGFGKIGSSAAKAFSDNGARVIAVSTYKGAIHNTKGLDVAKLLELKAQYADDVVNYYADAEKITKDDLLCSPVDILLPCAGPWTINSANAHKTKARIICPGANIPTTDEAEKILLNQRTISLPDFVTNSGGVLGAFMGSMVGERGKKEIIEKHFRKRVSRLIQLAREKGIPPTQIAEEIAITRFHQIKARYEKETFRKKMSFTMKSLVPKVYKQIFVRPRAKNIFAQMLHSTE